MKKDTVQNLVLGHKKLFEIIAGIYSYLCILAMFAGVLGFVIGCAGVVVGFLLANYYEISLDDLLEDGNEIYYIEDYELVEEEVENEKAETKRLA